MIITIDGPVASGKSTVSRILADRLDYYYFAQDCFIEQLHIFWLIVMDIHQKH